MRRRRFLQTGVLAWAGLSLTRCRKSDDGEGAGIVRGKGPIVISTWNFGVDANRAAYEVLSSGGTAVDAAERGVMVSESDPAVDSVGYGGLPNNEGVVELDAAIMNGTDLEAGSVAGLHDIMNPVAVARHVMDDTVHVLLVGDGARRFAIEKGFETQDLLTPEAEKRWRERFVDAAPVGEHEGRDSHDTIGMVTMDADGHMAAACTTSGLAWKLPGRVGDSPLIGHGLYCDETAGGAVATGVGEEVIKVCGSYQVVEFMRQGIDPNEAVRRVIDRVLKRDPANHDKLVAFAALRADGEIGYGSTVDGFQVAVSRDGQHDLIDSPTLG